MRLTQQGANRLTDEACQFNGKEFYLIPSLLETHDFDPEELTGAVVLGVDEANAILWAMNPNPDDIKWRDLLEKRIEQAKKVSE